MRRSAFQEFEPEISGHGLAETILAMEAFALELPAWHPAWLSVGES
jgi:hypothetical protein